jgi:hypothetical protein
MKLSDFVAQRIFELEIKHVFMVTGGGAMHLNHSFGTHPGIEVVYNHHEKACYIAAESYVHKTYPEITNRADVAWFGDVVITTTGDLQENVIEGTITSNFLNKKTINL